MTPNPVELAEAHFGRVVGYAGKLARSVGRLFELDDVVSDATLVLWECAREWVDGPVSFPTFLFQRVRWAVIDGVRTRTHYRASRRYTTVPLEELVEDIDLENYRALGYEVPFEDIALVQQVFAVAATLGPHGCRVVNAIYRDELLQDVAREIGRHPSRVTQIGLEVAAGIRAELGCDPERMPPPEYRPRRRPYRQSRPRRAIRAS